MVLSLVDLSLISISNGIKDGTIQNPHMLPPNLRQLVLDTVLKRGLINDPNCLAILSSVEFLNGMTTISTSAGSTYDDQFLRRLIISMGVKLPNGETVGAAIKKLDLSVYGCTGYFADHNVVFEMGFSSFPTVSQLIAQCPNVTSLALRGVESDGPLKEEQVNYTLYTSWFPCIFNQNIACDRVMENLVELSVSNWTHHTGVFGSGRQINDFKQLSKLKLDNCSVVANEWPELLRKIPTLEYLQMIDVRREGEDEKGLEWVLPFSMPHLNWLEIDGHGHPSSLYRFKCNEAFMDNLMGCPELRQVHLVLDEQSTDEESMVRLATMDIDLKIKTQLYIRDNAIRAAYEGLMDSSSHFKIVSIFHNRMESFELMLLKECSPLLSMALEDVITKCSNLTSFKIICLPEYIGPLSRQEEIISAEEFKRFNGALVQFFGASERALQLKDLYLRGDFDETVMSAIFGNCLNLTQLEMSKCPALRDQHLIDWVSRDGGKLSILSLSRCENVTSEGIIPILEKSAECLLRINIYPNLDQGGGRDWKAALKIHCPNSKIVV